MGERGGEGETKRETGEKGVKVLLCAVHLQLGAAVSSSGPGEHEIQCGASAQASVDAHVSVCVCVCLSVCLSGGQ